MNKKYLCPRCKEAELRPVFTPCERFVEAEQCPKCGGSWWKQIPVHATKEHVRRFKKFVEAK